MSKYGNTRVTYEGRTFDSKRELARYKQLRLLEQAGVISGLVCQPKYELLPGFRDAAGKKQSAISYWADFEYQEGGKTVVEDAKGVITTSFALKVKMFRYRYRDIELRIVK
jgi:hypothetical protein